MFPSTCHLGGVEPIAEVAGDGEELELPQEMTKFIKKKQPSKKVKKGRSTDSSITPNLLFTVLSSCLLPSFMSLFGAECSPALGFISSASPCHFSNRPVSKYITPAVHPQHCSQLATKSWPEPWHWYLFTVCHTVVIHLYFPSRHGAPSVICTYHFDCRWLALCRISMVWILLGARRWNQTIHLDADATWMRAVNLELCWFVFFHLSFPVCVAVTFTSSCIRLTLITLWSGCIWRSNDDKIRQWNPSFCVLMTKSRDWTCCWSDQMTFALINRWFVQSHANYFWVWRPFSKRFLSVLFQVVYLAHRVITLIGLTTSKLATKKSRHYWSTQFRQNRLKPVRT